MTKMNGTNLPDMTEQENLAEIFNDSYNKRKKMQNEFVDIKKTELAAMKFGNNNTIKVIDKQIDSPQNLKRKSNKEDENYSMHKNVHTELNITIDKDSNRTIRLELRHPSVVDDNLTAGFKNQDQDHEESVMVENGDLNEYAMKPNDEMISDKELGNGDLTVRSDYLNSSDSQDADVSNITFSRF